MVNFLSFSFLFLALAAAAPTQSSSDALLQRRDDDQPAPQQAIALDRTGWTITSDNYQADTPPNNALDGDSKSIYHSQWSPNTALPHTLTIDMKGTFVVSGVSYLPRQDGGSNGNIGQHNIELSTDGNNWNLVAKGTYLDDNTLKRTFFASMPARYIRITALSEAGNRGTWTSAAEINVLSFPAPPVSRAGWKVTADSQNPGNEASAAIDGDVNSMWHTAYNTNPPPGLPHYFTIDRGNNVPISGLSYLPRPANTGGNGRIGNFRVESSTDNQNWNALVSGTWGDDATLKAINFKQTTARYIRLVSLTEAGGRGPWTSAAEINLLDGAPKFTPPSNILGHWGPTIDFPLVPAAAAALYNGKILAWSSWSASRFDGPGSAQTVTSHFDPNTGMVDHSTITNTQHDMFCPGISIDAEGRPFVTGGNSSPKTSVFNVASGSWTSDTNMQKARGYQASAALSDGRIFTIGGSWSGGNGGKNGEVYSPASNTWTLLNGCDVTKMLTDDNQDKQMKTTYRADNHGWLFGWKKGFVFQAGPSKQMNWYGTSGSGSTAAAGNRGNDNHAMNGNAVMYDAVAGKILSLGGAPNYQDNDATSNANVITIGEPGTKATVTSAGNMSFRRAFANAVALPDGKVFVAGGQTYPIPFSDANSILHPEIWDPETGKFTTMNPHSIPRNYHSVALLMPDATVFTAGGGLCFGCIETVQVDNHYDGQVFSPPYLFDAAGRPANRPKITQSTDSVQVGGTITASTDGPVAKWSLVRFGSATHTVDTDQRRIPLTASGSGNGPYTMTVPNDAGIALPGYWMLFAMNTAGVPSVAKTVKITI